MEEERKEGQINAMLKEKEKKRDTLKRQREEATDKRFETLIGAISSLSIPPLLVAGMLGTKKKMRSDVLSFTQLFKE